MFGSEFPARASFAQNVSIKKRFVKRFTALECFCIPQRDSSSFVVKLKYIRGVAHTNPPFVSGPLLLIAKVVHESRPYTKPSIEFTKRSVISSTIEVVKLSDRESRGSIRERCMD